MNFKKDVLPYILIFVLFIALAVAYCYPVLQGKVIGNADGVNGTAAVQECLDYRHAEGGNSWWTGALFSGMPNYQIGGAHYLSERVLKPFYNFFHWGHSNQIMTIFFYLIAFFILMRAFGVGKWASVAGAIAVAFSSYFLIIIGANHGGKTSSLAWMTLVVVGMLLIYKKKYGWGSALVMFFTAMGLTPHPQMAYYILLMAGVLWCAELYIHIRDKQMKQWLVATLIFAASFAIGLGVTSANAFANKEYMTQTMRGGHSDLGQDGASAAKSAGGLDIDYATQWSYGIDETLTFLVPNFMGGSSNYELGRGSVLYKDMVAKGVQPSAAAQFCASVPTYWGDQPFTSGPVYLGAIVCLLFVLGLFIVKSPYKWALLAATLFSVFLSWGYHFMPFTKLFFNWFPLYDKFRTVSSILVVAEITIPLLGFLAVKEIAGGKLERKSLVKALAWSAGITGGLCLILALGGKALLPFTGMGDVYLEQQLSDIWSWFFPMLVEQRAAMLSADAWRSLLFIVLGAAVLWFMASGKLKQTWASALLAVLILVDLWGVDQRYFNASYFQSPGQFESNFAIQPWEKEILADKDPNFRVFNLVGGNPFNENRTSYRLKSIGGYSAAKLRRYQDLIDQHLGQMHMPVIDMLNTKYFVTEQEGQAVVVPNEHALGNAWFADSLCAVKGADAECAALMQVNLASTMVVDTDAFGSYVEGFRPAGEGARVQLTKYRPDYLEYDCSSPSGGAIVFSEIYYPYGWKATIDGQPAEHFRANYTLRAMNVPAGEHHIRFEFRPDSVRKGDTISLVCIVLMFGIMAFFAVRGILSARKAKDATVA